jgi:diguanylate cyclase (GGDEF)-like protein
LKEPMPMPPSPKLESKAATPEFRHGLRRLDRNTSWMKWNAILVIVALPVSVFLLSFTDAGLFGHALLFLVWGLNIFTLYQQRHLKAFRNRLVEQMDAASKQRIRAEKFYGLAILDPLTGLYNRRFGEERLKEEIEQAEKTGQPLIVLAADLDWFKETNDQYGHAAGDLVLKGFSRRLQRAIRACDVPIRVGGDEFLVILPDCPPEQVEMILSRLGSVQVSLDGQNIPVRFSRGWAQHQVGDTPESIVRRADERLYEAKQSRPTADRDEVESV